MNRKEYTLPNGKKAVFEYDVNEIGKVTLECMDMLMAMISDRPQGEWIDRSDGGRILNPWWEYYECNRCGYYGSGTWNYRPNCGAKMKG